MGCSLQHQQQPCCANPLPTAEGTDLQWSQATADELQRVIDMTFAEERACGLQGLKFSFTIADPTVKDCPLIGCSTGFQTLVGYSLNDILGKNCRFLLDPVPQHLVNQRLRKHVKEFCLAVGQNRTYTIPMEERESWCPDGRNNDEMFCYQINATKDGNLFNNMFYLRVLSAGDTVGEEKPYIVGLQTNLPRGKEDMEALIKNLEQLDKNMDEVEATLTKFLYIQTGMRRQIHDWNPDEEEE